MKAFVCLLLVTSHVYCSYHSESVIAQTDEQEIINSFALYKNGQDLVQRYETLHETWRNQLFNSKRIEKAFFDHLKSFDLHACQHCLPEEIAIHFNLRGWLKHFLDNNPTIVDTCHKHTIDLKKIPFIIEIPVQFSENNEYKLTLLHHACISDHVDQETTNLILKYPSQTINAWAHPSKFNAFDIAVEENKKISATLYKHHALPYGNERAKDIRCIFMDQGVEVPHRFYTNGELHDDWSLEDYV